MFYDEILKRMTRPGVKMVKLITEKREKIYQRKVRDMETGQINTVDVAKGWEIVKETATTEEGEKIWKALHPEATPSLQVEETMDIEQ